jgi:glycosyltransferase involved in cell wall biosynthesis
VQPRTVLSVHNFYRQAGGEDEVYRQETELLNSHGHVVTRYEEHNERIRAGGLTGLTATWNQGSYGRLRELARAHKPDVAHFYNTFPLISPAAYYAVRGQGAAIVQKLSNFRLLCPGAMLSRDGRACEECLEQKSFLPAVKHGCYRKSRPATAAVALMVAAHRGVHTWDRLVDVYIAHTECARQKFIEGGLPHDRVAVKPHMIWPDPGQGDGRGDYALFVGRLSEEKGVHALAEAWQDLADIPLRVAGDGPLAGIHWPRGVTWLGNQSRENVSALMKDARVVIVPSVCFEIGPLTVLEGFAAGTPVIASDLGSMAERVAHGRTGLLFKPGDPEDLARQVRWAFDHPEELRAMRANARREYEEKYTAERNYKMLMAIYEMAIENSQRRRREAS